MIILSTFNFETNTNRQPWSAGIPNDAYFVNMSRDFIYLFFSSTDKSILNVRILVPIRRRERLIETITASG